MRVFSGVVLAGLLGVMHGVVEMTFRDMRMVAGRFMITRRMVLGGEVMMFGSVLVVFRCLAMVLRGIFRHVEPSSMAMKLVPNLGT